MSPAEETLARVREILLTPSPIEPHGPREKTMNWMEKLDALKAVMDAYRPIRRDQ